MKTKYMYLPGLLLLILLAVSCDDNEKGDRNAPSPITDIRFVPNNGGGYFLYNIPEDPDFLYVQADYNIDSGETVSKTCSTYGDTLFIEGLGQVKEYEVKLYAIDRNENRSQPIVMNITPLYPNTELVLETLQIQPGFSALIASWENKLTQTVDVFINIREEDAQAEKAYSSNLPLDRFLIGNLEDKSYQISAYVKDKYGNQSETRDFGTIRPLTDYPITKDKWSFLRNNLLYGDKWDYNSSDDPARQVPLPGYQETFRDDSLKNAAESFYEGRIEKFWDDIIDDPVRENLNYFNTGPQSFPFSYFIDMGRTIQASRIKYWQKLNDMYRGENVAQFEIWISDETNPAQGIFDWEYVGTYTIIRPSDEVVARNEAFNGHEFILYPDRPQYTKPFRYLRFKATRSADNRNVGVGSELTVYGIE